MLITICFSRLWLLVRQRSASTWISTFTCNCLKDSATASANSCNTWGSGICSCTSLPCSAAIALNFWIRLLARVILLMISSQLCWYSLRMVLSSSSVAPSFCNSSTNSLICCNWLLAAVRQIPIGVFISWAMPDTRPPSAAIFCCSTITCWARSNTNSDCSSSLVCSLTCLANSSL